MEFINKLKELGIFYEFEKLKIRVYNAIKLNNDYELSIQASSNHYCLPKEMIPIENYDSYEVAIFLQNNFAEPKELKNFKKYNELQKYKSQCGYSFVPKELVEELYLFAKENM